MYVLTPQNAIAPLSYAKQLESHMLKMTLDEEQFYNRANEQVVFTHSGPPSSGWESVSAAVIGDVYAHLMKLRPLSNLD